MSDQVEKPIQKSEILVVPDNFVYSVPQLAILLAVDETTKKASQILKPFETDQGNLLSSSCLKNNLVLLSPQFITHIENRNKISFYSMSPEAVFAKSLAGHLFNWVNSYDINLEDVFGVHIRSVRRTERISKSGLDEKEQTIKDIQNARLTILNQLLSSDQSYTSLNNLSDADLLQVIFLSNKNLIDLQLDQYVKESIYEIDKDKLQSYSFPPNIKPKTLKRNKELLKIISNFEGNISTQKIIEYLERQETIDFKFSSESTLRSNISNLLGLLVKADAIKVVKNVKECKAKIQSDKLEAVRAIVSIMRRSNNSDPKFTQEGLNLGRKIVQDKNALKNVLKYIY